MHWADFYKIMMVGLEEMTYAWTNRLQTSLLQSAQTSFEEINIVKLKSGLPQAFSAGFGPWQGKSCSKNEFLDWSFPQNLIRLAEQNIEGHLL